MLNLMKTLTATCGISGREKAISDKLLTIVAPLADKLKFEIPILLIKKNTGGINIC